LLVCHSPSDYRNPGKCYNRMPIWIDSGQCYLMKPSIAGDEDHESLGATGFWFVLSQSSEKLASLFLF
jgi:hypothetical protein